MQRDPKRAPPSEDADRVTCPECGARVEVDERQAARDGFVVCPRGHRIALMGMM